MPKRLYVGNMSYSTTEERLRQLFEPYGEVTSVSIITDRETGKARGFGFVEMGSEEAAGAAITALNGRNVDGRELKVNEAQERPRRDDNRAR
jgi:RNA recognition motif-containing protein